MKMVLDTNKRTVRDKRDVNDAMLDQYQLEADVMNILAFAIASKAMSYFKSIDIQQAYINRISEAAKNMLTWEKINH